MSVAETLPQPTTASDLLRLPYADAVQLFGELSPPPFDEMDGEYRGSLLDQGPAVMLWVASIAVHLKGRWCAKAFRSEGDERGRGYNVFVMRDRVVRGTRMRTDIGPSRFDGRPSFRIDYSPFMKGPLGTMRDEVRKVSDGLYLGMSVGGYGRWMKRRPFAFVLEGPVGSFVDGV